MASQICMYTSFFKRQRQYDTFKAKEIINREILPQQTASQVCMYTPFFKRERQCDTFKAKEIINREILPQLDKRRARYTCTLHSLSVSDNDMFKRKKLSIERYCHNKWQARYACVPRSLRVSDNMTHLKLKKLSIERYCHNKR